MVFLLVLTGHLLLFGTCAFWPQTRVFTSQVVVLWEHLAACIMLCVLEMDHFASWKRQQAHSFSQGCGCSFMGHKCSKPSMSQSVATVFMLPSGRPRQGLCHLPRCRPFQLATSRFKSHASALRLSNSGFQSWLHTESCKELLKLPPGRL